MIRTSIRKTLQKNFQLEGKIVHNGFSKGRNGQSVNKHILWIANFLPRKNPHLFMELAKKIPNEKFVMIGGDRDPRFKEDIMNLAEKVPNLEIKGYLPFKEANKEFRKAKLFVNTSNYEGFSNAFLQAWSYATPVISFVDPDNLIKENRLDMRVHDIWITIFRNIHTRPQRFPKCPTKALGTLTK